mmetsp:Transcript_61934/g.191763  ORF Transcript_61934/g.191763 Transcript_61934/m.191763 type:complete len:557 (-) Transcript_61934:102-1772(-)
MFSPEMMQAAQKMMANMKPEDMQRMSQMAANMDPKMMESMMKNMGGGQVPAGVDTKQAFEQMRNMSPEQLQAQMSQAQTQMSAQKQYMKNAAEMLKNEGNNNVKAEKYSEALTKYSKALENLNPHVGEDIDSLKVSLLNNSALCHLKTKDYDAALKASEDALKVDSQSFKALFRRGQAKAELGKLGEAVADVRSAAELSPGDKAIAAELERLRGQLKERGVQEPPIETHRVRAEWQQPPGDAATPSTSSGSRASSSSSARVDAGSDRWAQTAERIAENPDMLKQASEFMSNLSPEDMERMMNSAPNMMPGMTKEQFRSQMEHVQKNPGMLKSAMEALQAMPEDERKKMFSRQGGPVPGGGCGVPDPAAVSKMFDDPAMLQQAMNMTKDLSEEDLKKMNIHSKEQADMMRQAAEQMASNPELTKGLTDMMKNMSPDQVQEMMKLSGGMRGGGAGGMGPPGNMDPSAMMSDPDMLKATEEMMKNMSPETLASMAKASGMDISEDKAKLIAKFLPLIMRLMRWFGYLKRLWAAMWSKNGRLVLAGVVVGIAVLQHMRSG